MEINQLDDIEIKMVRPKNVLINLDQSWVKNQNIIHNHTCIDYLCCWRVGLLLVHNSKYQTVLRLKKQSAGLPLSLDSAAGGAKETKAPNQAVMPLRGKIKNCTTLELPDVIKSDIIKNILTCLGCGIGDHFNIDNLRYNRLIIMTDADADGGHIELLLVTLLLHHLPELIKQGKVYAAVPPLYKTVTAKETRYWTPDQLSEYKKYVRNHKNIDIVRFKGLGEMNPDELYETTMNPEHRTLVQLTTDNMEETLGLYDRLMGKQPSLRRDFIMSNKLSSIEDDDLFEDEETDEQEKLNG